MKSGIIITAMAALAFAVFAVAEAQDDWGADVDQRLFGHMITIDEPAEPGITTAVINGIAKGEPGSAQVTAVLVYEQPFVPNSNCPPGFVLGADVISLQWGETYNDGSLLAGSADPDQVICLNADATQSAADVTGSIDASTGRFEGASGTWRIEAFSIPGISPVTGTLTADFN